MASISSDGGEKDMISGLPEEVLSHILSFLPLEDAIKSTLLLKRFRNLWRSFPRLTIDTWSYNWGDHSHSDDQKLAKLIHHVLIHHEKVKIDELCLRHCFFFEYFNNPDYSMNPSPELQTRILEEKRFGSVLDSFVSFAIIKRCKVLELDFINAGEEDLALYMLPTIVYRSIHLTQLSLVACNITSCDEVWLKSLKILHLRAVGMSDEAMKKFMLGCPSLEELSIDYCYGLRNLCCNSIKLKKLKINHLEKNSLIVSNLNVVFLEITGTSLESVVVLKSNVVDADVFSLMMMRKRERISYDGFKFLLQSLDQCKTFRPCRWSLMVLAKWELTNIPCPYFKWNHLVLELWLTSCVQVGLSALLRHVPLLKSLKINVQTRPDVESTTDQTRWLEEYELDEDKYWNEAKASLEKLKIVVIHGDCIVAEPAVIHVAKFLLRNAVALKKMVISTKKKINLNAPSHIFTSGGGMKPEKGHLLTDELTCIMENLVASPKASTKAVICFS